MHGQLVRLRDRGSDPFLALATYPVSVIFRALGWRELARTDRFAAVVPIAVGF